MSFNDLMAVMLGLSVILFMFGLVRNIESPQTKWGWFVIAAPCWFLWELLCSGGLAEKYLYQSLDRIVKGFYHSSYQPSKQE